MPRPAARIEQRRPLDREGIPDNGSSSDSDRLASLAALTMNRQAPSLLLPASLSAPTSLSLVKGDDKALALARSLVELGLGSDATWKQHGGNCSLFVRSALNEWLAELGAKRLPDHINLDLAVIDEVDSETAKEGNLFMLVETSDGCGCLMVGEAVEALEAESAGLGSAFYDVLSCLMCQWMEIYEIEAARHFVERWRESIEMDFDPADGESPEQSFEEHCLAHDLIFPDLEHGIPLCLREPRQLRRTRLKSVLELLRAHRHGRYAGLIEPLLAMAAIRGSNRPSIEDAFGIWDDRPLPNWLLCFSRHDAVSHAFDEEGQTMHESSHAPTWIDTFNPRDVREVKAVLTQVRNLVEINLQIVELSKAIAKLTKATAKGTSKRKPTHGSTGQHQFDDKLRAA